MIFNTKLKGIFLFYLLVVSTIKFVKFFLVVKVACNDFRLMQAFRLLILELQYLIVV